MSTDTKLIGKKVNVQIIKPKILLQYQLKKSTRELSVEFMDKQDESIKSYWRRSKKSNNWIDNLVKNNNLKE